MSAPIPSPAACTAGVRLLQALAAVRDLHDPAAALTAVDRGDFGPARQLVDDCDHVCALVAPLFDASTPLGTQAVDWIGDVVSSLMRGWDVDAVLEERDPVRIADAILHEEFLRVMHPEAFGGES